MYDSRNEPQSLSRLSEILASGGVIAVPTDTVFGLVCDPRDHVAVDRIFAIKHRPASLELTLLAATADDLDPYVVWNDVALLLAKEFWPGALSIILPAKDVRVRLAIPRHGDTLSVRVPDHAELCELLKQTGPLASTSANRHGEPPLAEVTEVQDQLGLELDGVMEARSGGQPPSTIIDCSQHHPKLLREGPISEADLMAVIGDKNARS